VDTQPSVGGKCDFIPLDLPFGTTLSLEGETRRVAKKVETNKTVTCFDGRQ
jgi:hypothetical protein